MRAARLLTALAVALAASIAAALAAPIAGSAPPARIAMKRSVVVAERQVTLGDIASIEGVDDAARAMLAAVVLAMAPRPGFTERLTREEVRRKVRARLPAMRESLAWSGAEAVDIEAATAILSGERLRAIAVRHVEESIAPRHEKVEAVAADTVADVVVPPGAVDLRPRSLPTDGAVARRVPVWIDVIVNGAFHRALAVPVNVKAFNTVLVARADLAAGREANPADFEARRLDVAQLGAESVSARADLAGKRLKRVVRAGAVLVAADLQARPAVARGDQVRLQLKSPLVQLEARVVALADGAVGEDVWVKREPAGEALRAYVVAPGIVEVAHR